MVLIHLDVCPSVFLSLILTARNEPMEKLLPRLIPLSLSLFVTAIEWEVRGLVDHNLILTKACARIIAGD